MNTHTNILAALSPVSAGDPFQGSEEVERLDLNKFLTNNSDQCLLLHIEGDSMSEDGIESGDWVILCRDRLPKSGDIIIALLNGGYTVKRYEAKHGLKLVPGNSRYAEKVVTEEDEYRPLGVVTCVIKRFT